MQEESSPSYEVIRSKRKTLALTINSKAEVLVRAPLRASDKTIHTFVCEKQDWIFKKQALMQERAARHQPLLLAEGEQALYLGKYYRVSRRPVKSIALEDGCIIVPVNKSKSDFILWMKARARQVIQQRVRYFAGCMGVEYTAIRLSSAQKRWGSCSAKNSLNFAWRLIMCPPWVIDYIVVHELAHISHKNHGAQFWAQVAEFYPEYKKARAWLKENIGLMYVL